CIASLQKQICFIWNTENWHLRNFDFLAHKIFHSVHVNTFGGEKISCGTIQSGGVIEDDKTSEGEVEVAADCGTKVENAVKNGSARKKLQLNLSENTLNQLLELQEKGLEIDELFNEFLQKRNQEIAHSIDEWGGFKYFV
ncbi:MAG: hypothetical protein U1D98_01605, partial [Candidatus Gracilibacteria bacterium]|nr:hypothetical protein [Candidatus Gracilibacteria bacterium]